jgi:KaiC/GvpD/RAD55 family RecA-like ATPase
MEIQLKGSLEDNLLTLLVWSEEHAPMLAMRLGKELFSTRVYQDIAQAGLKYIEDYGKPPGPHIRDLFEKRLTRGGDEGRFLKQAIDAMEALAPDIQPDFVFAELDRFVEERLFSNSLEESLEALSRGDLSAAREALHGQLSHNSFDTEGTWLHDADKALRFLDEIEQDNFSTGIQVLDDHGVRPRRKSLMVFMAASNFGKSWFAINTGKQGLLNGISTLHITLEMQEEEVTQRYVQALYSMTEKESAQVRISMFNRNEMGHVIDLGQDILEPAALVKASRAKVASKLRQLKTRAPILIKEFPTGTLTIGQLVLYLDYLKRVHNFEPDQLIIDSPDLMDIDAKELRVSTGRLFKAIRGLGASRNKDRGGMAIIVTTQADAASANAKTVKMTNFSEDWSKIGTADMVITGSQTEEEYQLGLARILVGKARRQRKNVMALITQSYTVGQFCLDSVYMSAKLGEDIKRMTGDK